MTTNYKSHSGKENQQMKIQVIRTFKYREHP